MEQSDLIQELSAAFAGNRKLDAAIANAIGWRRKVEQVKKGDDGAVIRRVMWVIPSTNDAVKAPFFTSSLDAAFDLAREIAPDHEIGVSWAAGVYTAVVGNGGYFHAATPALALCAAALSVKKQNEVT
jgi:hypothetical protein